MTSKATTADRDDVSASGESVAAGGPAASGRAAPERGPSARVPVGPAPGDASANEAPSVSTSSAVEPSFVRRHRLPLALAVLALCLYVGSIVYILLGRGQIA